MAEKEITLPITGMTCANCANTIEKALGKLDGVKQVDVNLVLERANLRYDGEALAQQDIVDRVDLIGYGVATATLDPTWARSWFLCASSARAWRGGLFRSQLGLSRALVTPAQWSSSSESMSK